MKKIVIFGASSSIGSELIEDLRDFEVYFVSRNNQKLKHLDIKYIKYDLLECDWTYPVKDFDYCIFCADSSLVLKIPEELKIKHIIFVSSASKILKIKSKDQNDISLVGELDRAESFVCNKYKTYTIIRPTWVFDGHGDKISKIVSVLAQRMKILPFTSKPYGKRNPIDPKTISLVISEIIGNKSIKTCTAFNVGGARVYNYDVIIKMIVAKNKIKFVPIYLPLIVYRVILGILHRFNILSHIHDYMFSHMEMDLSVDNTLLPDILQNIINYNNNKFWGNYEKF